MGKRNIFLLIFGLILLIVGCEYQFSPFEENEEFYFSIQGVLDPIKEVQSIRVSPVRQSFRQPSDPFDAVVTLTHIESGMTVQMEAVLERYAENAWAWNYTADLPILYENSYKVTVTRSDGAVSRATATIPKAVDDPEFTCHCDIGEFTFADIFLGNVERLAVAKVTYNWGASSSFRPPLDAINNQIHEKSLINNNLTPPEPGGRRVWISVDDDMDELADLFDRPRTSLFINSIHVELASAGPEWPETNLFTEEELTLSTVSGNVENGIGQLAGAVGLGTVVIDHNYPCPDGFPPPPCGWVIEE